MLPGQAMRKKFKNITLVIPDPEAFISGGNIYNLHFLKALRTYDPGIKNIDFETFKNLEEAEKVDCYLIDTYYFEALKDYKGDLSSTYLLVHLLESLNQEGEEQLAYFQNEEASVLNRFKGFMSTSHFTHAYLCSLGYEDKAHLILPPAISFQAIKKKKAVGKINALMVNNLMQRKGVLDLLEAIKKAELSADQFHLTIIGNETIEPEYASKVKTILEDERLQDLAEYIGVLPHKEVREYYELANLYISSAYMETFGISLQEAVAYRIPILAYDGGNAFYHIEEGINGHLFDSNTALVSTLEKLCQQKDEFEMLLDRAWAFRKFENYTWSTVVKSFVQQLALINNAIK